MGIVLADTQVHTVADEVRIAQRLLREGAESHELWRFAVLQTLDDYESAKRYVGHANLVFAEEPEIIGHPVDAAVSALAAYLADRDGWTPSPWGNSTARITSPPWYVSGLTTGYFRDEADMYTPPQFRARGVMIGINDLDRV